MLFFRHLAPQLIDPGALIGGLRRRGLGIRGRFRFRSAIGVSGQRTAGVGLSSGPPSSLSGTALRAVPPRSPPLPPRLALTLTNPG